jgi:hypothetical protein
MWSPESVMGVVVGKSLRVGVALSLILAATAAGACGDKLSAFSRAVKHSNGAHRAQILLLAPVGSAAAILAANPQFQRALKTGRHGLRIADSEDRLASELASKNFDLVLADGDIAAKLEEQIRAKSFSTVFVPVLNSPSKSELRDMEHRYSVVLTAHAKSGRYLDILDDAVQLHMERSQLTRTARK